MPLEHKMDKNVFSPFDPELFKKGPTSLIDLAVNLTTANPDKTTDTGGSTCEIWPSTHNPMLKVSMVLLTLAFLVPPKKFHRYAIVVFRAFAAAGAVGAVVWGVQICSPDVIIWNFVFVGVNLMHLLYNCYKLIPPRFDENFKKIYETHFVQFKVSKRNFEKLKLLSSPCALAAGEVYYTENGRGACKSIAILVKGRLIASCAAQVLHDVKPYEFVDCFEWQWRDRNEDRLETRFQVTVTAEEDSELVCWPIRDLETLKMQDYSLYTIFDHLIAKDAVDKLYRCLEAKSEPKRSATSAHSPFQSPASSRSISLCKHFYEDNDEMEPMRKLSNGSSLGRVSPAPSNSLSVGSPYLQVPIIPRK